MEWRKIMMILSVGTLLTSLCAQDALANADRQSFARQSYATPAFKVDNWYALGKDLRVQNGRDEAVHPAGTEFTVIELSEDGTRMKIGIDNDMTADPVVMWVFTSNVERAQAVLVDVEAVEAFADIGIGLEFIRRGRARGGMTFCLRDVRTRATRWTRCIPQNVSMASIAYPRYKAMGWHEIGYSPGVPDGTACFFGGGRPCGKKGSGVYCGHAAIKLGPNRWLGAGVSASPYLSNRSDGGRVPYRFHGCLTPPARGAKCG